MKKLNITEKAIRYDVAIERAKFCLKDGTITNTAISYIETIFPELKESEDDRIRKAIKKALQVRCDGSRIISDEPVTLEEAIAWLEKQGQTFTKKDVDDAYLKGICDAKHELEKQGEQFLANFFKTFKDEQNLAWSEEDERIYQSIMDDTVQENQLNDKQTNWLKSIKDRVQPKQEWSGSDESHLHSLITHLEQWIESNPDTTGADIQGENIAWLKSKVCVR